MDDTATAPAPAPPPPVCGRLRRRLRRAVLEHAIGEHRRSYPALLHLGEPGGREVVVPTDGMDDHGLRADVVAAMLARHHGEAVATPAEGEALLWLTRHGDLDLQDLDAAWLAAAWSAHAERGLPLTMVVVNRHGWRDPRTGASQQWVRLRRR